MATSDQSRLPLSVHSLLRKDFPAQLRSLRASLDTLLQAVDKEFFRPGAGRERRKAQGELDQAVRLLNCGSILRALSGARSFNAGMNQVLEQIDYTGRRLAKLGLDPDGVIDRLSAYNRLLDKELQRSNGPVRDAMQVQSQVHALTVVRLNEAFYQVRSSESQASYELFRAETESLELTEKAHRYLRILRNYTGAAVGCVYLVDPSTTSIRLLASDPEVNRPSQSTASASARLDWKRIETPQCLNLGKEADRRAALADGKLGSARTVWSMPVRSGGRLAYVFQFGFEKDYVWLPREIELLAGAAERFGEAAEKSQLIAQLREGEQKIRDLAQHMVEVEESERRRISRELHDEAGQSLLCVRLQLEMIEQELGSGNEEIRKKLIETRDVTEHTILEIRRLIAALSPSILEQMGLAAAIRQLVMRFRKIHPAGVRVQLPRRIDLDKKTEIIVYRLVQEVFNNIAKYSAASNVNLLMESADGLLRLSIEDDGVGFDVQEAFSRRDCFGLSGLRERVTLLGGALEVQSSQQVVQSTVRAPQTTSGSREASRDRAREAGRETSRQKSKLTEEAVQVRKRVTGKSGIDSSGTRIRIQFPVGSESSRSKERKR